MLTIFYNIFSIVVGLILIFFGVLNIKKNKILLSILIFIHAFCFLVAGIGGFFLPKEYEYITILAMLALCITIAITLLLLMKKPNQKKDASDKKTLE